VALPHPAWPKRECLIQKAHRFAYDRAYRAAGMTIVDVDTRESFANAINEKTAMIAVLGMVERDPQPQVMQPQELIEIGRKAGVPVIVDAGVGTASDAAIAMELGCAGGGNIVPMAVEMPDANLLGSAGGGVEILMSGLDYERLVLTGGPLGLMRAALDLIVPYLHDREQFGRPIGSFQLMQAKLADLYATCNASRAYAYAVARACDAGRTTRYDAAACLLAASENATRAGLEAIQVLGGNGYINEYPAGRILRDAKLYEIGAGTNEIRRMLIGRELVRATAP